MMTNTDYIFKLFEEVQNIVDDVFLDIICHLSMNRQ